MSDWQAGDIALCVCGGPSSTGRGDAPDYPRAGKVYHVGSVGIGLFTSGPSISLYLTDGPLNIRANQKEKTPIWPASRFVKITPGHTITGSEVDQREPWKVGV